MVKGWKDSIKTGNELIDSQHYYLLVSLEKLSGSENSDESILQMLDDLMEILIDHFTDEEGLMTEYNYPSDLSKEMITQHQKFKSYIQLRIFDICSEDKINILPLQKYMLNFLQEHEFGMDIGLAEWIKKNDEHRKAS